MKLIGSIDLMRVPGTKLVQRNGKIYTMTLVENNPVICRTRSGVLLKIRVNSAVKDDKDVAYVFAAMTDLELSLSLTDGQRAKYTPLIGSLHPVQPKEKEITVEDINSDTIIDIPVYEDIEEQE